MFSETGWASRSGALRSVQILERISGKAFSSGQVAILNQSGSQRDRRCDERQTAMATWAGPYPPRESKSRVNVWNWTLLI